MFVFLLFISPEIYSFIVRFGKHNAIRLISEKECKVEEKQRYGRLEELIGESRKRERWGKRKKERKKREPIKLKTEREREKSTVENKNG